MISQLHIKNFKSIVDLTLDLGRVNLFIGENGCGKSNILEAVALLSLDRSKLGASNDFSIINRELADKGSRTSQLNLFSSAFDVTKKDIFFEVDIDGHHIPSKYEFYQGEFDDNSEEGFRDTSWLNAIREMSQLSHEFGVAKTSIDPEEANTLGYDLAFSINPEAPKDIVEKFEALGNYVHLRYGRYLTKYMIYSPELSYLRKFEEEGQVKPLGARGEGLFSLIKSMASDNGALNHVKEYMQAIDWFEDFSIPGDLMFNEHRLTIKDRFINSDLGYFDQRSANEGFLFLLFYIVLFSSKRTPRFFSIDNIEASFNPKLCAKLIIMLTELAKKNDKQVLMTTHNPATLDGLNLNDPEQRLFVVRRNIDGHTIATRITEKPNVSAPMKLSEMWTKGLLGGLPDNF